MALASALGGTTMAAAASVGWVSRHSGQPSAAIRQKAKNARIRGEPRTLFQRAHDGAYVALVHALVGRSGPFAQAIGVQFAAHLRTRFPGDLLQHLGVFDALRKDRLHALRLDH